LVFHIQFERLSPSSFSDTSVLLNFLNVISSITLLRGDYPGVVTGAIVSAIDSSLPALQPTS